MDNILIVEVLLVEDIGKLLDISIVELIVCFFGVIGECCNGCISGIFVCGFNENYVGMLLNGCEFLGMGDNCGVEFDFYLMEIILNILVYKILEVGMII